MSYLVVESVLDNGPADSKETLVLVAIAEFASDIGYAFPGVSRIAHRARCCERHTIRIIKKLAVDGWLVILPKAEGPGRKQTAYQLNLQKLADSASHDFQVAHEKSRSIENKRRKAESHESQTAPEKSPDILPTSHVTFGPLSHDISLFPILKNHEPSVIEPSLVLSPRCERTLKKSIGVRAPDLRHAVFKKAIFANYAEFAPREVPREAPWDSSEAKQLACLLRANPNLTVEDFESILRNRSGSDGTVHTDRPRVWLANATRFLCGPLDRYSKSPTKGVPDGKRSRFETIAETSRRALAILAGEDSANDCDGRSLQQSNHRSIF